MRVILCLVAALTVACATTGQGQRRDPYVISFDEIDASVYTNAHDIIQALRPQWLRPLAGTSINAGQGVIRVYMDGARTPSLEGIPKRAILEMRFYRPAEAQARWGLSHHRGAIDVITRTGS